MLIDRTQSRWALATALIGAAAVAVYLWDAPRHLNGPSGSTAVGITLGSCALAIMLFCAALSLKRRVPHWRIGKAKTWLRAHVWLGLLTVLLVGLHGAFKTGGTLTTLLWVLLGFVTLSGFAGILLQQFLPRLLLHSVPGETLYQQLGRQLENIRTLAEQVVIESAGSLEAPKTAAISADLEYTPPEPDAPEAGEPIARFYRDYLKPFLEGDPGSQLAQTDRAASLFMALRTMTPPRLHGAVDELASLCERRREFQRQRRMMIVLFAWLIVHVPASWALIVLAIVHAVVALRWKGI
ncbi:MAG: hypothetical protein EA379_05840 [Phycisphaerales bacterium]|nr:MAG: hypothetical protein EA379_05840 [Phycisphaerales bacterium]